MRTATNPALLNYDRRYKVPALDGTQPKLCKTCNEWFPARKRERTCFACLPADKRRNRLAQVITFRASAADRKSQVRLTVNQVRELAYAAAAEKDLPTVTILAEPRTPERRCPVNGGTPGWLSREHFRAIREGRQGCICGGTA